MHFANKAQFISKLMQYRRNTYEILMQIKDQYCTNIKLCNDKKMANIK